MSVLHDGRPAGPYAENQFRNHEHVDNNVWINDFGVEGYFGCDSGWNGNKSGTRCIHYWCDQLAWKTDGHTPTPQNDGIGELWDLNDYTDYVFGFQRASQLTDWFTGQFKTLHRYGFVVGVYSAPVEYTKHGICQSIFKYSESERVAELSVMGRKRLPDLLCFPAR
jgi:hypothetical protein